MNSAKFLLRDTSSSHEILQYLLSSLTSFGVPLNQHQSSSFMHLLYVFTEIFRLLSKGELAQHELDTYPTHFRAHFPWIAQTVYARAGDGERAGIANLVEGWERSGYISSFQLDVIMHAESYKLDNFKTIDIDRAGAGTLCATLTSHLRLSHGDYNETIFRNTDDVSAAYRRIESRPDTDVEDFIRNFT
jgi:hypothetical protein